MASKLTVCWQQDGYHFLPSLLNLFMIAIIQKKFLHVLNYTNYTEYPVTHSSYEALE